MPRSPGWMKLQMRFLPHAALACAALAAAGPAAAQTFPTKQIRTVVTCPTRGGPHELARTGAVEISKSAKVVTDSDANAE